jgi:hypothetical protein
MSSTRILIGYIAALQLNVLCDGDACIVMGSKFKFRSHLASNDQTRDKDYVLKKGWFDDILTGIQFGAAYAFDEEAYRLFLPLAQRAGLDLKREDFSAAPPSDLPQPPIHLVRVQWLPTPKP